MSEIFYAVRENVLSHDDNAWLYAWSMANMYRSNTNVGTRYEDKVLQYNQVQVKRTRIIMTKVMNAMLGMLVEYFGLTPETKFEAVGLSKWCRGDSLSLHADNAYWTPDDPKLHKKPNYVPQRTHTAVYYQNNEYIGGNLYFLDGQEFRPPHNGIVMFTGGLDAVHGVREIEGGERWTMPCWFTETPKYYMFDADGHVRSPEVINDIPDHNQPAHDHMKELTG